MSLYYKTTFGKLYHNDCLKTLNFLVHKNIKVDMVLCDPPYGITKCKWDSIIDLPKMWELLLQIRRDEHTPILFTSAEPFTSILVSSNIKMFKYDLIWEKTQSTGFYNVNKMPLRAHENILVFYERLPYYNPIKTSGHIRKTATKRVDHKSDVYNNNTRDVTYDSTERFPRSVMTFSKDIQHSKLHPTQKPVSLFEYLINTFSKERNIILDFCAGSCTTAVACINTNRKFICIEKEEKYCKVAKNRIKERLNALL